MGRRRWSYSRVQQPLQPQRPQQEQQGRWQGRLWQRQWGQQERSTDAAAAAADGSWCSGGVKAVAAIPCVVDTALQPSPRHVPFQHATQAVVFVLSHGSEGSLGLMWVLLHACSL